MRFFSFFLIFLIIIFDQLTKIVIGQVLSISCNKGIAFGIGLDGTLGVLLSIVVLSLIFYLMTREKKALLVFSFVLIFGGGVSNLIDRLVIGCVRDFVNLGFWPSFNLADAAITVGVLLLILSSFRDMTRKKQGSARI